MGTTPSIDAASVPASKDVGPTFSIAEVASLTGLSRDTLRYYEKAGLIAPIDRSSGGQRRYAATDMAWIEFLIRLRATGMSIADMQRFAELRRDGDISVEQRLDLLARHKRSVEKHIDELRGHLVALDDKITHYQDLKDTAPMNEESTR